MNMDISLGRFLRIRFYIEYRVVSYYNKINRFKIVIGIWDRNLFYTIWDISILRKRLTD